MRRSSWAAAALVALGSSACTTETAAGTGDGALVGDLLVQAAASLTDAFERIEEEFERAHPGVDVVLNLAGSSTLREQVLAGAPADVFASADVTNMDALVAAGRVDGEVAVLAGNTIVLAVPAGNPAGVTGLDDLARDELFVGLCARGVPCGDLGRILLGAAEVEAAPDTNEPDVRALLTKLAAGELDAGLVYATDVEASEGAVERVELEGVPAVVTRYPIAVLADAPNPDAAAAFVAFVLGEEGRSVLVDLGFQLP